MRVAVAGGTGLAGRHVAAALRDLGHDPVVLARSAGVDLLTGAGLDAALESVAAVVDVSNTTAVTRRAAVGFFDTAGRMLLDAERRAGVAHHVVLSIVGVDRVGLGYYRGKLRQERLAAAGPVPCTVLRATQFHEFPRQLLDRTPGPVAAVPKARVQPVAVREVGAALAELAVGPPLGVAPELAGPREEYLPDMVRGVARARGERRLVLPVPLPGAAGRAVAEGALLPSGRAARARQAFDEWLAEEAGRAALKRWTT
ncbi:SDR family oxidoreductase [Actinacidiphila yeochonensis]|uniref:SDR family oxidoreductase n=1 Tax=Actinacidiphila yeochonensis TaxID=89050 RepID=UPI000563486A|nr:3-beta hydroxysteroid dehydrogenase [Actinacidiphila yeochonensis]